MSTTFQVKKADGSSSGTATGSAKLFSKTVNKGLLHQAVLTEAVNSRQDTKKTKTRAEVHHTTRKPYKQKGTGRARQGMTSAPHYRHGGIALGPRPRDMHNSLPKKMRRAAISAALSSKAAENLIVVVDSISFDTISTKTAANMIKALELTGKRVLIILAEHNAVVHKSFRNIPKIEVRFAPAFSTRDVLIAETVLITKDALDKIEAAWGGELENEAEPAEAEA